MKRFILFFSFAFILLSFIDSYAQSRGSISGNIQDAANKKPLEGATITLQELNRSVLSDSTGRYRIKNLIPGSYTLSVSYIGYQQESKYNISVTTGNENELSFEMQPATASAAEVIVRSSRKTAKASSLETPLSVQRLTSEEIKANPGGNFDISRVINSLPGVGGSSGSVGGFRNDIIIRGGGPGENVFYLDGIEIPVINHFATQGSGGGPTGILNVSFIEDVKVSTSAFDAKYDNALSSVFEFKQKNGNPDRTQGNIRLSGTELAATLEGPLSKNKKLKFLASARRSYLQLLFSVFDLPIRPNFWDFQYKLTYKPDIKSTLTLLGVGAIDEFGFGKIKTNSQVKLYTLNQAPLITQNSYTVGAAYRRTMQNGYMFLSLSRNQLDNNIEKYDSNDKSSLQNLRFKTNATETENKLRFEITHNANGWKLGLGAMAQYEEYNSDNNIRRRAAVDNQPEDRFLFSSGINFFKFGIFTQAGKKFFDNRLGVNAGVRTDINSFANDGKNVLNAFSPRMAMSYVLSDKWTLNATAGRYAKLVPYTILGYKDNAGNFANRDNNYITNYHYAAGIEFLPKASTRFTLEGFYKRYKHVPVTVKDGININNLGADFGAVGNEPVTPTGRGETYGVEFFAQQKLTKQFFGIFSYTFFYSKFSNRDDVLSPSAWDNRHLASLTFGYKFKRNWELGIKYRFQGGAPFTPFDLTLSQQNFLTQGQGILDYTRFNKQRLSNFSVADLRVDKKWNLKKTTVDVYLDVSNFLAAKAVAYPQFALQRDLSSGAFSTTDGEPIRLDGSNGIPLIINDDAPVVIPTIGFIVEF